MCVCVGFDLKTRNTRCCCNKSEIQKCVKQCKAISGKFLELNLKIQLYNSLVCRTNPVISSTNSSKIRYKLDYFVLLIPVYSTIFKPIQSYSTIFQPIPGYSSIFQPIPTYSSIFQSIPAYFSLFQPIPSYSWLF